MLGLPRRLQLPGRAGVTWARNVVVDGRHPVWCRRLVEVFGVIPVSSIIMIDALRDVINRHYLQHPEEFMTASNGHSAFEQSVPETSWILNWYESILEFDKFVTKAGRQRVTINREIWIRTIGRVHNRASRLVFHLTNATSASLVSKTLPEVMNIIEHVEDCLFRSRHREKHYIWLSQHHLRQ